MFIHLPSVQSTYMASGSIDEAAVYQCTGNPLPQDVETIITWLMNEDFATCYKSEAPFVLFQEDINSVKEPFCYTAQAEHSA